MELSIHLGLRVPSIFLDPDAVKAKRSAAWEPRKRAVTRSGRQQEVHTGLEDQTQDPRVTVTVESPVWVRSPVPQAGGRVTSGACEAG